MARYELTIWSKGNKFGVTKLFATKKSALKDLKIKKRNHRYKKHQLLRIKSSFYKSRTR